MSSTTSRKETERTKLIQEKCQTLLTQMLRDEDNKYCVDCDAKGPRWASWNLGVFLCIRCAGIHRNLGVHISRVKSVNLDTWTPEQVISLQQMGNSRARAVYEAQLPDGFRRPQTDTALESFIRSKYEHKKYVAREWVPPPPPKVDWAKEIDEELEKQKRKKKAAQATTALGLTVTSSVSSDKKTSLKSTPLPAPLPKPKPGQSGSSPKTHRIPVSSTGGDSNQSNDLLGLSSPTRPVAVTSTGNDSFSGFLSASPVGVDGLLDNHAINANMQHNSGNNAQNSLAKEEEDFFNQGSLCTATNGLSGDKSGKMTNDSIMALYAHQNPQITNFGQPQPQQPPSSMFGLMGGGTSGLPQGAAFTGMAPGYMHGNTAAGVPHQPQFMTPPNSTSMYNSPVMTAPTAFTASGMGQMNCYSTQFQLQQQQQGAMGGAPSMLGFQSAQQQQMSSGGGMSMGGMGIMATGQVPSNNINLMQTNQSLLSGMSISTSIAPSPMMMGGQANQMANAYNMTGMPMNFAMGGGLGVSGISMATNYQTPTGAAAAATANVATANLNQQFGNLNIGNVWQ